MPATLKTIKATVDTDGTVHLNQPIKVDEPVQAVVTLLLEEDETNTTLLSEPVLAKDWDTEEENEAWAHLQEAK